MMHLYHRGMWEALLVNITADTAVNVPTRDAVQQATGHATLMISNDIHWGNPCFLSSSLNRFFLSSKLFNPSFPSPFLRQELRTNPPDGTVPTTELPSVKVPANYYGVRTTQHRHTVRYISTHPSRFVKFVLRGCPQNKNTLLGPFDGQQHRNCLTVRTGLRAIRHDARGDEDKKGSSSHHNVSTKTKKH
jgi:hypothetical protein